MLIKQSFAYKTLYRDIFNNSYTLAYGNGIWIIWCRLLQLCDRN